VDRDVTLTVLGDDPVDIVVPLAHPAAATAHHRLTDLAGETWVAGCDRCRAHLVATCRRAGFTPTIAFTTDDLVTQQALVAADLAVAAMPRSTLGAHANAGVRAAPCTELGARRITVAVIGDPVPPAVAALRDRLSGLAAMPLG
jgi:DNA-binding transcriptional LysR family regulator